MKILDLQLQATLDNFYDEFIEIVPTDEILFDLKIEGILSDREMDEIRNHVHKKDGTKQLFDILRRRCRQNDLQKFCRKLQKNQVRTIQKFGEKLSRAISNRGSRER